MRKLILFLIVIAALYGLWTGYRLYWRTGDPDIVATIVIPDGATFATVQDLLVQKGILPARDARLLKWYVRWNDLDTKLATGDVQIVIGGSVQDVAQAIANKPRAVKKLTIIEGWDLHDLKKYLVEQDIKGAGGLFNYTGIPGWDYRKEKGQPTKFLNESFNVLKHKPWYVSFEGYLFPDTYEMYEDATVEDVLKKMLARTDHFIDQGAIDLFRFHDMNVHEALTMASIAEREVRGLDDRRKVVDILLRRNAQNWAFQVDSTVNYVTGGDRPAITLKDAEIDSLYNTYKYPGFPLGPIAMPSQQALQATTNPWGNQYFYFLTDPEGNVHYAETLEQHNENKRKYLSN